MNHDRGPVDENRPSALRLVHAEGPALTAHNTDRFSDAPALDRTDPRWTIAAWIQGRLCAHSGEGRELYESLVERCRAFGFSPMHASAMIQIVCRAQSRGGLDHTAMDELAQIPLTSPTLGKGHRVFVFGMLCIWALAIAGIMVAVSRMM